jgi:hypothetical protein
MRAPLTFVLALSACSPFGEAVVTTPPGDDAGTTADSGAIGPKCGSNVLDSSLGDLTGFTKSTRGMFFLDPVTTQWKSAPAALRAYADGPNSHAYVFHAFAIPSASFCARLAFDLLVESGPVSAGLTVAKVRLRSAPISEGVDLVVTSDLRVRIEQGPLTEPIGALSPGAFTHMELSIVMRNGSQTLRTKVGDEERQVDVSVPAPAGMYELDLGILPGSGLTNLFIDDVVLDVGAL